MRTVYTRNNTPRPIECVPMTEVMILKAPIPKCGHASFGKKVCTLSVLHTCAQCIWRYSITRQVCANGVGDNDGGKNAGGAGMLVACCTYASYTERCEMRGTCCSHVSDIYYILLTHCPNSSHSIFISELSPPSPPLSAVVPHLVV